MMMIHASGWALVRSGPDTGMIFGYHIHIIFGKHSLRHNLGIDTTVWKAASKRGADCFLYESSVRRGWLLRSELRMWGIVSISDKRGRWDWEGVVFARLP